MAMERRGELQRVQSLGVKPACYLEERAGFKALWLATGEGEKRVADWKAWPFDDVSKAEYDMLTIPQQGSAQGAMQSEIDRILKRRGFKGNEEAA